MYRISHMCSSKRIHRRCRNGAGRWSSEVRQLLSDRREHGEATIQGWPVFCKRKNGGETSELDVIGTDQLLVLLSSLIYLPHEPAQGMFLGPSLHSPELLPAGLFVLCPSIAAFVRTLKWGMKAENENWTAIRSINTRAR